MKKRKYGLFLNEIKIQTNFSLISFNNLKKSLNEYLSFEDRTEESILSFNEVWYYLQNYVVSLANISKLLYPTRKYKETNGSYEKRLNERNFILDTLNLPKNLELKNKQMRNTLEYIDEKLEVFSDKDAMRVDQNIGPSNSIAINGIEIMSEDGDWLRNLITDKAEFILLGKRLNIERTLSEVIMLRDSIIERDKEFKRGDMDDLFSES